MIMKQMKHVMGEKDRKDIERKHVKQIKKRPLHGRFLRVTEDVDGIKSWAQLKKKGQLQTEIGNQIVAAQVQAIKTNNFRKIYMKRTCQKNVEPVQPETRQWHTF